MGGESVRSERKGELMFVRTTARRQAPTLPKIIFPMKKPHPSLRLILGFAVLAPAFLAAAPESVDLNWLGGKAAAAPTGVSWGVPWPKGAVTKAQAFSLSSADGKSLPLQSWPLAYWPDGSL